MAQIADKCPGIIQFCRTRITLLDDDGTTAAGPDNMYVSSKIVTLAISQDREEGQRRTVLNGCGCPVVTKRDDPQLFGWQFELVDGVWEPAMTSMMLGYDEIYDTSDDPVIIGENIPADYSSCGSTVRKVALEAWAYAWDNKEQDADLGLIHFLWPLTKWAEGNIGTLGQDALTPTLTGFSEANTNWDDPYADNPNSGTTPVVVDFHARWMEDITALPDDSCGRQTVTPV